jgi:cyclopropane fatty-acyl-phospholipid synthase-like methyltransferase
VRESGYDRERIARIFNERARSGIPLSGRQRQEGDISQRVKELALSKLELREEDVLLDVGTGLGEIAVLAAKKCRLVIGIDIARECLRRACEKAKRVGVENVIFAYGSFEDPSAELNLDTYPINKVLALYSMHHLPDHLKKRALEKLFDLIKRPGRIVIGDIMFFEDPEKHRGKFEEVHYDGGEIDFPARVEFFKSLKGAEVSLFRVHPLAGVVVYELL